MTQAADEAEYSRAQIAALVRNLPSHLACRYWCAHSPTTNRETTGHSPELSSSRQS